MQEVLSVEVMRRSDAAAIAAGTPGRELMRRAGEAVFRLTAGRPQTIHDRSAAVTGLLLAMTLPAAVPYWLAGLGGFLSTFLFKGLCGGLGQNAFNPALGNAAVMDIGVYPLHMAAYLFGRPTGVRSASVFLQNGFEGAGNAILTYEGGFLVDVAWSKITQSQNPSVFLGEDGSITVDKVSSPTKIELRRRGEAPVLLPVSPLENNMDYELRAFLRCIGGDAATLSRTRDASLATAAVVEAIRFANHIRF